jgi:hypothetical protein
MSSPRDEQFLDVAVAQGEAEINPNRVLDDLGRKVMTAVTKRNHADTLSYWLLASDAVVVTMPANRLPAPTELKVHPRHSQPCC